MQAEERYSRIENHLQKVEFSSLDELSEQLDVSVSTIRRDLTSLEKKGNIRRTHGGARIIQPKTDDYVFATRNTRKTDEKEAIGKACADLINSHQTTILDAGSTVYHVAAHLGEKSPPIITNSLPITNLFSGNNLTEVVVTGGIIYPRLEVLVGPLAVESFSKVHADIAVMSASGITAEGIYNSHALLIDIQKEMLQSADKVILCLDHTKFDRRSMFFLTDFDPIDCIVTDSKAPMDLVEELREKGIEVIIAPDA
jgi:DeoR/GlpR family transcriptional regulator of sugar metabolism